MCHTVDAANARRTNAAQSECQSGERVLEHAGVGALKDISRCTWGSCRTCLDVQLSEVSLVTVKRSGAPACAYGGRSLLRFTCDAATRLSQTGVVA